VTARSLYQLEAAWTSDAGAPLRLASLRGKPVLLTMFFAQCEYACPVLVHDMKRLLAALPESVRGEVQLVLVSFDTARDTPAALRAFRERMNLNAQWTLLRGAAADVQELAMLLGVKFKQDVRGQFAHSNLITVLDAEGEVVHQHAGLHGDVSAAARAIAVAGKTVSSAAAP
jgi:protein SCO1/2